MAEKEEKKSYALLYLIMCVALIGVTIWAIWNETFTRRPWKQYQGRYSRLEEQYLKDKYTRLKEEFESPDVQAEYMEVKKHLDEAKSSLYSPNTKRYYEGLLTENRILEEKQLPPLMFDANAARSELLEQKYLYSVDHSEETLKKIHDLEETISKLENRIEATKNREEELGGRIAEVTSEVSKHAKQLGTFTEKMDKVQDAFVSVYQKHATIQTYQVYFEEMNEADRCMTCHLGINRTESVSTEQPYAIHPKREFYLGAHPPERFGCILCHNGQGRATASPEKAHGEVEYWLTPVLRGSEAHTSCIKCHPEESNLQGASVASKGKRLFKDLGCYGCHTTKGFEKYEAERIAPDLLELPHKVYAEWLPEWIRNTKGFRPDTRMPDFKFSADEAVAIAAYLWQNASTVPLPLKIKADEKGSVEEGKALFENIGCLACHKDGEKGSSYAPNLSRIGDKVRYDFLVNWLVDPKIIQAKTNMPNLRLTDEEGIHIATYLSALKGSELGVSAETVKELNNPQKAEEGKKLIDWYGCFGCHQISGTEGKGKIGVELSSIGSKPIGQFDFGINEKAILQKVGLRFVEENTFKARKAWIAEKLRDTWQFDVGRYKTHAEKLKMPYYNLSPDEIDALTVFLIGLTDEELPYRFWYTVSDKKRAIEEGRELVEKYNCTGCHQFTPDKITLVDNTKLVGAIKLKEEDNLYLQLWEENVPLEKKVGETIPVSFAQIKEHIPAEGGDIIPLIRSHFEEEGLLPEEANVFAPPRLYAEGKKVQPLWLFEFLLKPIGLRPWLKVRMPTYEMSSQEATKVAKFFSLIENEDYPYVDIEEIKKEYLEEKEKKFPDYLAKAKVLFEAKDVNCGSCHVQGSKTPEGDPSEWAPDLSLARVRLRPTWITKWLLDPQAIEPGTKMPRFFRTGELQDYFPGTPEEQATAIKDLLMNFSVMSSPGELAKTGF
ncbi:MAG: c-type cytochrome [Planctomycetes bacterium]|nr:c-type cytochrome [Planctomycetota bacterium]